MNKIAKKPSKPTKKNEPYSTLEDFESLCRRAMVYHQTGEYLPPDPQMSICKNKSKKQSGPSRKIVNENKNKSTKFGQGRIGVSCQSYGIKRCACCNPQFHQNSLANNDYDIMQMLSRLEHLNDPIIIDSPNTVTQKNNNHPNETIIIDDTFNLSPENRIKTEIIELDDSVLNSSKDVKINYDVYNSTIIELSSDESQGVIIDSNSTESSLSTQDSDDISIITQENGDTNVENAITSTMLLSEKKKRDDCDLDITAIFTEKRIDDSPKSSVNAKADAKLSKKELLQKEIDDCDRNLRNIFRKHPVINLTLTPDRSIPKTNNVQTTPKNTSTVQTNSKKIGDCPICLESLGTKDLMSTICGHIFCSECIKKVIKTTRACPTCRYPLTLKRIHPIFL